MKSLIEILLEHPTLDQIITYEVHSGNLNGEKGRGTFKGIINFFKMKGIKIYDLINFSHLKKLAQGLPVEIDHYKGKITLQKEPQMGKVY